MNEQEKVGQNGPPCESAPQNTVDNGEGRKAAASLLPPLPQAAAGAGGGAAGAADDVPAVLLSSKLRQPLKAGRADGWFALGGYVLGYLFIEWFSFVGWGTALFTLVYAGAVLAYALARGVKPRRESWYWLAILLLCGLSFALWPAGEVLALPRMLLLFGGALYWCGSLFGILLQKNTGNFIIFDALNLMFLVPFRNFFALLLCLKGFGRQKSAENKKKYATAKIVGSVVLGAVLCIPILALVTPMLLAADGGNFAGLVNWLNEVLQSIFSARVVWQLILAVPVALYLVGLVAGAAHGRYADAFKLASLEGGKNEARIAPHATVCTVLGVVCALYLAFIVSQVPYFFAAFAGQMSGGYVLYAEYARDGFFELCRVASFNAVLLLVAGCMGKKSVRESRLLRGLHWALAGLTLLLIATALRKMVLYIQQHGFTQKRITTCVFMVFLAAVFVAALFLPFKKFSIARFGAMLGAGMLCALCLCNLDGLVARYNADGFLAGRLAVYEFELVDRSGGSWRRPCGAPGPLPSTARAG